MGLELAHLRMTGFHTQLAPEYQNSESLDILLEQLTFNCSISFWDKSLIWQILPDSICACKTLPTWKKTCSKKTFMEPDQYLAIIYIPATLWLKITSNNF